MGGWVGQWVWVEWGWGGGGGTKYIVYSMYYTVYSFYSFIYIFILNLKIRLLKTPSTDGHLC